jgi:hypothetical protein
MRIEPGHGDESLSSLDGARRGAALQRLGLEGLGDEGEALRSFGEDGGVLTVKKGEMLVENASQRRVKSRKRGKKRKEKRRNVLIHQPSQKPIRKRRRLLIIDDRQRVDPRVDILLDILDLGAVEVQNLRNTRARVLRSKNIVVAAGVRSLDDFE